MRSVAELIENSQDILIIQADNPDGDSLASSLALEAILMDLGKSVRMYCGVDMPTYLRYMNGWDRVTNNLPNKFDASIIVDTGAVTLLETLAKNNQLALISSKPCAIIDHHATEPTIEFAKYGLIQPAVASAELIYLVARQQKWKISLDAAEFIAIGIMSDSLGLASEATNSASIRVVADLVDMGVSLAKIDNLRRQSQKKSRKILAYKAELIRRIEYYADDTIAIIQIPWSEIEEYSHEYNPAMLVLDEMRQVNNVKVAVALKSYPDKRVTAKIRTNYGYGLADKIAESFGGGGHAYASGFRVTDGRSAD